MALLILKETFIPFQHNWRRVPVHLLGKLESELKKLIDEKQIIKLDKCSDEELHRRSTLYNQNEKNLKIALQFKKLHDAIHKNEYQLHSTDHRIDSVAKYISEQKTIAENS